MRQVAWAAMTAALMLAAGAQAAAKPAAPAKARAPQIADAAFGLFKLDADGVPDAFHETGTVPDVEGQAYGWMIQLNGAGAKVRWREEFTLPAAPRSWGLASELRSLSEDARTAITNGESAPEDGAIRNVWTVAPGDPLGTYRIKVTVEGAGERVFVFEMK